MNLARMFGKVRILLTFLVALVCTSAAWADYVFPFSYIDENGETQTVTEYTILTGNETEISSGWYVVYSNISYSETLKGSGDIHIVLVDGSEMCIGSSKEPVHGLGIVGGNWTIYGQKSQRGKIIAYTDNFASAVAVSSMTINGGQFFLNAVGTNGDGLYVSHDLIINRGYVITNSNAAEGIKAGGDVVINGGDIYATGGDYGLSAEGNIVINGGYVRATTTKSDGLFSKKSIAINGGKVYATNVVGDGVSASENISLGYTYDTNRIQAKSFKAGGSIAIKDDLSLKDEDDNVYSGTLTDEQIEAIAGKSLRPALPPIQYVDENGNEQSIADYGILTGEETSLENGWFVARGNLTYNSTLYIRDSVRLILADGVTINVGTSENPVTGYHGIHGLVGRLTIYGQREQTGALNVYASEYSAISMTRCNLVVNGGSVSATANADNYVGIYADSIKISGGSITARSNNGAGIETSKFIIDGGSVSASSDKLNGVDVGGMIVNDGSIIAYSDKKTGLSASKLILNSGSVSASSSKSSKCVDIYEMTINGGDVTANEILGTRMTVNDGEITASRISVNKVTINGGVVSATYLSSGQGRGSLIVNNGFVTTAAPGGIAFNDSVIINGGVVSATCNASGSCYGISAGLGGNITLGYTKDTDRIMAGKYEVLTIAELNIVGSVKIKDGQILTDGEGNLYFGTLTDEQIDAIAGKTLAPTTHPLIVSVDGEGHKHAYFEGDFIGSEPVNITEDTYVDAIDFVRTFTAGAYATIVFPFDVNTDQLGGVQKVSRCDGFVLQDNGRWALRIKRLWTDESTTPIELSANTPYMVMMKDETLVVKGGVTLRKSKEPVSAVGNTSWEFRGTLAYQKWEEGNGDLGHVYGFAGQAMSGIKVGEFVKVGADAYISPLRAYLYKAPEASTVKSNYAGAKATSSIGLPDEIDIIEDEGDGDEKTTVIGRINTRTGELKTLQTYDLKGRRVNGVRKARGAYYGKRK